MQAMNVSIVRKAATLGVVVFACLALGACRSGPARCAKPGVYAQAESIPPLRIPAGLQAPDTRGALHVPEVDGTPAPLPAGTTCLDQPPRYAPNAQLTKPEGEKRSRRGGRKEAPAAPAATPKAEAPAPAPAPPR